VVTIPEVYKNNYYFTTITGQWTRHLDGIKGNFYIAEQEYVAPSTFMRRESFQNG